MINYSLKVLMENSRTPQLIIFKPYTILSSTMKSRTVWLHRTSDVNHHFGQCPRAVLPPLLLVT